MTPQTLSVYLLIILQVFVVKIHLSLNAIALIIANAKDNHECIIEIMRKLDSFEHVLVYCYAFILSLFFVFILSKLTHRKE